MINKNNSNLMNVLSGILVVVSISLGAIQLYDKFKKPKKTCNCKNKSPHGA